MVIKIENQNITRKDIFSRAKLRILYYPMSAQDYFLEKFIKKKYRVNLQTAALYVLSHIKITYNEDNTKDIIINDPQIDKLVNLINFGNGRCNGSKILRYAFD